VLVCNGKNIGVPTVGKGKRGSHGGGGKGSGIRERREGGGDEKETKAKTKGGNNIAQGRTEERNVKKTKNWMWEPIKEGALKLG